MTEYKWPERECFHTQVFMQLDYNHRGLFWRWLWCADCGHKFDDRVEPG